MSKQECNVFESKAGCLRGRYLAVGRANISGSPGTIADDHRVEWYRFDNKYPDLVDG
jgi:hypothetical protein